MCGIAGSLQTKNLNHNVIEQVTSLMCERGPDSVQHKSFVFSKFCLDFIFSRLAIIDPSNLAMQPIQFDNYIIILNGEIYNFKNLRTSLESKFGKQEWKSNGDVEVALRYLVLNGIESVKDFDGMFAFSLVDIKNEIIYFGRDYFGEKPLYILKEGNSIFFGSEPKLIWALKSKQSRININQLRKFLVSGYRCIFKTTEEFFEDIYRVKPGTVEVYSLNEARTSKIINFREVPVSKLPTKKTVPKDLMLRDVRNLVIESVGLRLESDVPLAICLSGGVDSGLIAAIAKKDFGVALDAYTLVSSDSRYSEGENASFVAKHLGLKHTLVEVKREGFLQRLAKIIQYHDSPVSTISYFVQNFLMEKIHEDGFKVSLMGTGADEIFTGYYDHHLLYLASMYKSDKSLYQNSLHKWEKKILPLIRNPIYKKFDLYVKDPNFRDHIYEGSELLQKFLLKPTQNQFSEVKITGNLLRNRMLNELFYEVVPVILHEDDRNSMMYSIENRSPFLSKRLVEKILSIDDQYLIQDGLGKYLLRKAFDGYLPDKILYSARKIGFNASIFELCDFDSFEFNEFLNQESMFWASVNKNKVKKFFSNIGHEDFYNKAAFNIISSKMFCDIFG